MDCIDEARKKREIDGEFKYGRISPNTDKRCFKREMVEEMLDALNYADWSLRKGEISGRQHSVIQADVKRLIRLLLPCKRPSVSGTTQEGVF